VKRNFKIFIVFILLFISKISYSQLCSGSLGDAIVNITFGAGTNPGLPLSAATTAYNFVVSDCPSDGNYTVRSNTNACFGNTWHTLNADHTGNTNGYFMLVNASIQPSAFYIDTVRGLCGNSTYEFAAWMVNVLKNTSCGVNAIQPNITFSIEKLDGSVIQTFNTGSIPASSSPEWKQYGYFFTTPVGVSNVVLRMTNNATGGCGNDLALDDITFRPCGPKLTPAITGLSTTTTSLCEGVAKTFNFSCNISNGFNAPQFQWQSSFNGGVYVDMLGENASTLSINFLSTAITGTYKYRLTVAENGNLGLSQCRISSSDITVIVNRKPVYSVSWITFFCEGGPLKMSVSGEGVAYRWTGPNNFLAQTDSVIINNGQLINAGTYFVNIKDVNGCENDYSVDIAFRAKPFISTMFVDSFICVGKSIKLKAITNENIEWSPTNTISNANILDPIATPLETTKYKAVATNIFGCKDSVYTTIKIVKVPIVDAGEDKFVIANRPVLLNGNIEGDYESFIWSPASFLNNVNILSPISSPPSSIEYTLTASAKSGCGQVSDKVNVKILEGIFIPNAFSPNGDFKNDLWNIPALEAYPLHELMLFNRYGQIIFRRQKTFEGWDGKYKGILQPNGAYNYIIDLKNGQPLIKGSFLLLR
jgi:gliding motility-associated-like protein